MLRNVILLSVALSSVAYDASAIDCFTRVTAKDGEVNRVHGTSLGLKLLDNKKNLLERIDKGVSRELISEGDEDFPQGGMAYVTDSKGHTKNGKAYLMEYAIKVDYDQQDGATVPGIFVTKHTDLSVVGVRKTTVKKVKIHCYNIILTPIRSPYDPFEEDPIDDMRER